MEATNGERASESKRLASKVVDLCKTVDSDALVLHISHQPDESKIIRIKIAPDSSYRIVQILRPYWPFSVVTVIENVLEGTSCAEILFPNEEDERSQAIQLVKRGLAFRFFSVASLMSVGVVCIAVAASLALHLED